VSVTALRKRAAREGWTKQAFARAQGPIALPTALPAFAAGPELSPEAAIALRVEAVTARQIQPLYEEPEEMARRALGMAARAISEGDGLAAARLVRSARELRDLDGGMRPHGYWDDEEELPDVDGRREHMRVMVRSLALRLAQMIVAGTPLPAEFENLRAERPEDLQ
jgi:thioesterase domain-containing protein